MNFKLSLSSAIIGTAVITVICPNFAIALTPSEVAQVARQITVQIKSSHSGSGSGFMIKQSGEVYTVLTAAHVVPNGDQFVIYTSDGKHYSVLPTSIKPVIGLDLAILEFTSPQQYTIAKLGDSNKVQLLSLAYVSGFPAISAMSAETTYRLSTGQIAAQATYSLEDGYALAYFNNTFGGMSGGPVLNDQGEVIGIHGRSKSEFKNRGINPKTGIKLGINLAIPINRFLETSISQFPNLGLQNQSSPKVSNLMSAGNILFKGVENLTLGKYKEAIVEFNKSLKIDSGLASAYALRGYSRFRVDEYASSITDFDKAISLNLKFADIYIGKGHARANLGYFQGAVLDFEEAIKLDPSSSLAYASRGYARIGLLDYQGAKLDAEKALSLSSNNPMAYIVRGESYAALGNPEQAISDFDNAIQINPNNVLAYQMRGEFRLTLGDKKGSSLKRDTLRDELYISQRKTPCRSTRSGIVL